MNLIKKAAVALACVALASCGGGSDSSQSTPNELTLDIVLQQGVKILDNQSGTRLSAIEITDESWRLTIQGSPALAAGDSFVLDNVAYLAKNVTTSGNETIVLAELASVGSIIQSVKGKGKISIDANTLLETASLGTKNLQLFPASTTTNSFQINEGRLAGSRTTIQRTLDLETDFSLQFNDLKIGPINLGALDVEIENIQADLTTNLELQSKLMARALAAASQAQESEGVLGTGCIPIRTPTIPLAASFCIDVKWYAGDAGLISSWSLNSDISANVNQFSSVRYPAPAGRSVLYSPEAKYSGSVDFSIQGTRLENCKKETGAAYVGVAIAGRIEVLKFTNLTRIDVRRNVNIELTQRGTLTEQTEKEWALNSDGSTKLRVGEFDWTKVREYVQSLADKSSFFNTPLELALERIPEEPAVAYQAPEFVFQSVEFARSTPLGACQAPPPVVTIAQAPPEIGTNTISIGFDVNATNTSDISYQSSDPNVQITGDGQISVNGPGTYVVDVIVTGNDGNKYPYPQEIVIFPSGSYTGFWSGTDTGRFSINIDTEGNLQGFGISNEDGSTRSVSGKVRPDGALSFVVGTASGGASFTGVIKPLNGRWNISGSWSNPLSGYSGIFAGNSM